MNKKGFTLIELLAVIVILAIIALIAVPSVLNIIEDSRKSAAEASARNIVNAAQTYYISEIMKGNEVGTIDLSGTILKYDGEQAEKGYIEFSDGKASGKLYLNGYCVEVTSTGSVSSEKKDQDECEIPSTNTSTAFTKYNNGTPLLYDPVRNIKCIDTEVETNYNNYKSTHSYTYEDWDDNVGEYVDITVPTITGLNEGCMKWYAFLDSEDSSTVKLILDHNTTGAVEWNVDDKATTPDTALAQLALDVSGWHIDIKSTARLISGDEVNRISPRNSNAVGYGGTTGAWDVSNRMSYYNLHTGMADEDPYCFDEYVFDAGENTYAWLFENTWGCTSCGCNEDDEGTNSYWTSSYLLDSYVNYAWIVTNSGAFTSEQIYSPFVGVRPVIEVPKTIFTQN